MLDFDNLREIWSTMRKNKLRTFLTGFSVAWGIFMLVILLGAGNGLHNGVMYNFRDLSANRIEVWPRYTTKPWKGNRENRRLRLRNDDLVHLKTDFPEVDLYTGVIFHDDTLAYGKEFQTGEVRGVSPDFAKIDFVRIDSGKGRFINEIDMRERRKVIVLSPRMAEVLFHEANPLGQYVRIGQMMFQVIGVYYDKGMSNNMPAYLPFTTAQQLYRGGEGLSSLLFTVKGVTTQAENEAFEERFRGRMARRHQFDPTDKGALGIWNMGENIRMFTMMTNGILLFIWIVGIGTLMAGIVGVSNIMLVTVRERTREFGIRKAIGAKPSSILWLIIIESILITAAFGYVGMVMGIGVTEGVDYIMTMTGANSGSADGAQGEGVTLFRHPTVNLGIAVSATVLLIIAGVIAGYFPARKAVKIPAVEAMRVE
ncbi:ABC transporter permease [Tannerella forsythia]|uniref:FtsX-like permease family protein n=1 Tax=Tannerella forsythia TaxID=28112 RepID=A0A3P1ZAU3_TANFO|nr:ABC transporter permease [Tannerella forsythia]RRD79406.1 FtsX-like permease family protein [Tannerella forsythia]